MTLKSETFGDISTGQASLTIKSLKDGQFALVAYFPPGIDLFPVVYGRYDSLAEAEQAFNDRRKHVARYVSPISQ